MYLTSVPFSSSHYQKSVGYDIEEREHYCLCLKVFAEYENLPLNNRFQPSVQAFLHNIGAVPVNPFIAFSKKKKNRNSADLALALTVIEDIIVKDIPAEEIIICTCDIDLYPLLLWLKEHAGRKVYLGGFVKRTSKIYDTAMVDKKILLDVYFRELVFFIIPKSSRERFHFFRKNKREIQLS